MASTEGLPIIRPLWLEFPTDETTFAQQDQFMFGNDLLIAPRLEPTFVPGSSFIGDTSELFTSEPLNHEPRNLKLPSSVVWFDF